MLFDTSPQARTTAGGGAVSNCFGCAQGNPKGLRLAFQTSEDGALVAGVHLGRDYESFPGIVHGGIVATVMDEAMGRVVLDRTQQASVTVGIRVRYAQVMRSGHAHRVTARASGTQEDLVYTEAELRDERGELIATGTGTFLLLTPERVRALESNFPEVMVHSIRELQEQTRNGT